MEILKNVEAGRIPKLTIFIKIRDQVVECIGVSLGMESPFLLGGFSVSEIPLILLPVCQIVIHCGLVSIPIELLDTEAGQEGI